MNNDMKRFIALRKKVMQAIKRELEIDWHCKSYEGTFEWTVAYPNYFEDETGDRGANWFCLTLHCYVLGPSRHYDWGGKTKSECLDKAEKEIEEWLKQEVDDG